MREGDVPGAREPGAELRCTTSSRCDASSRRSRSSSFWSTTSTRTFGMRLRSTESSSRPSSSARPTVATTRSNDGSPCDTRRRLRDARADRPARLRARRRPDGERFLRARAREHPPADRLRPRAARRRRRLDGRHARVLDAVDDPRLRVLRNDERLGLAASLNRGLDEARGRYVARMDADDVALPDWLERQPRAARRRSRVGFVGCRGARHRR